MDYDMPIMNGLDATKYINKQIIKKEIKRDVPIVMLTAYTEEKEDCIKAGAALFSKFSSKFSD
jgi:CheY-like chemotaxis protein